MKRELNRLRKLCLALPETIEKIAWGEPTWRVAGKMFAMTNGVNAHHDGPLSVWLKSDFDTQAVLVESAPDRFFVPPCPSGARASKARPVRSSLGSASLRVALTRSLRAGFAVEGDHG